uniref:AMP-binding protein n=1 Tax=Acidobacterium capsulatum TaxID=33075 RepID=A0A7V4XTX8_9BACT
MRSTLTTLLDEYRKRGNETAVVSHRGVRRYKASYAEIVTLSDRFSAELLRREIRPGDRVILWGENSAEWIGAFYGCMQRGVLAVPLDAAGPTDFAQRILHETNPRLIAGDHELLRRLHAPNAPALAFADFPSALPAAQSSNIDSSVGPDTPVQILFTSGTTAEPKGIVHTHRNIVSSLAPIEREMQKYLRYERIVHPLRFLHTLPLSHVFGQFMGLWIPPLLGAEVHFDTRLQASHLIQTIHDERISLLVAVPRVLDILRSHLLDCNPELLTRLQTAQNSSVWQRWWRFRRIHSLLGYKFWAFVCGGASLPPDLESFWTTLGFALIQGYGMTESSALITLNHPFRPGRGTIGKVLPGREVRLSEEGEILVRGDIISSATWQQGALRPNDSPWLATGDLAKEDASGNMQFLGRRNQLIVTPSGMNVHPEDVESVLAQQPGVAACAVVPHAVPNGSEPAAVLVFRGSPQEAQQAILAANAALAGHQRIRYFKLWPELDLPRTATGKIQRRTLVAWLNQPNQPNQPKAQSPSANEDPVTRAIVSITARTPAELSDYSRLEEDFGLDSLGRVELQEKLESQLGHTLEDAALQQAVTLGDLRKVLGLQYVSAVDTNIRTPPAQAPALSKSTHPALPDLYPRWPWTLPARLLRNAFLQCVLRPLVWIFAAPRVQRAPASSHSKPLLIIANHVNNYDAALVLYGLPGKHRRRISIAMAADILSNWRQRRGDDLWMPSLTGPLVYWLVTLLFNVFPLPRGAGFRHSFEHAGRALDSGFDVLLFPEGHQTGGHLAPFRPGIGLLVQQTQAAVLPVALAGYSAPSSARGFHSGSIQVRIGQPLHFDPAASAESITEQLHAAMASLLGESRV